MTGMMRFKRVALFLRVRSGGQDARVDKLACIELLTSIPARLRNRSFGPLHYRRLFLTVLKLIPA